MIAHLHVFTRRSPQRRSCPSNVSLHFLTIVLCVPSIKKCKPRLVKPHLLNYNTYLLIGQSYEKRITLMNAEQDYGFDVAGFLHLPQVLSEGELKACNRAIETVGQTEGMLDWPAPWCNSFRVLMEHPVLQDCLKSLCGEGFAVDRAPHLIDAADDQASRVRLFGSDPDRNRRLRYLNDNGMRICHGVRIVWSLAPSTDDEGGIVLVPCSHRRSTEPPTDLLSGIDDLGMTIEPKLQPGDLLICAATTLHGVRGRPGRLVEVEYINPQAMQTAGFPENPAPEWTTELTPEQRMLVGPRTTGRGGTILSDGEQSWVAPAPKQALSHNDAVQNVLAPDPKELWFWDVRGYLVLRNVMDEAWLAAAHRAIDAALEAQPNLPTSHPSAVEEVPEAVLRENDGKWPEETSVRLRGEINRPRLGGLYHLPKPHSDPFRKMLAYPSVVRRLNWILGYGFREFFEPMCTIYPQGTTGGSLHGQNPVKYTNHNGVCHIDNCNVAWALHDEAPGFGENSGGFICIPGSHKAVYPIPRPPTTSIDLEPVYKPAMKAGDVLFFGGVAHGTTAWRSPWHRRTVIQFMCANNVSVKPGCERGWTWPTDLKIRARALSTKS